MMYQLHLEIKQIRLTLKKIKLLTEDFKDLKIRQVSS